MRIPRRLAAFAACLAAAVQLLPRPGAGQASEPRVVVFESFLRPT